ncbi:radical SAM protein [Stetteria hydrogenophila]
MRPDAVTIWSDPEVRRRLSWYLSVMNEKRPPKYIIAKHVDAPGFDSPEELEEADERSLWRSHDTGAAEFRRLWSEVREGSASLKRAERPRVSLLHVKAELARRLASPCRLCERRCMIERLKGKIGACRVDGKAYVHSAFLHLGEEAPLVPSGTIFYGGCNFTCVYCQNYDVSQTSPRSGIPVDARMLAKIQEELARRGARNINHVGGDPTPSMHVIIESLLYLEENIPQLWNSNMYLTTEAMKILVDVIDIWLPDFKYGNNRCALRLSAVPRYFETVTRNLRIAAENGDMIIRHLVLPSHLECCTIPVLEWIARNLPKDKVIVNVMDQYRPEHLVARYPQRWREIARRPTWEELKAAHDKARKLGLFTKV